MPKVIVLADIILLTKGNTDVIDIHNPEQWQWFVQGADDRRS